MGTCASGGNVITFAGELEKSSGGFGCMICTGEGAKYVRNGSVLGVYVFLSKAGEFVCTGVKISDPDRPSLMSGVITTGLVLLDSSCDTSYS